MKRLPYPSKSNTGTVQSPITQSIKKILEWFMELVIRLQSKDPRSSVDISLGDIQEIFESSYETKASVIVDESNDTNWRVILVPALSSEQIEELANDGTIIGGEDFEVFLNAPQKEQWSAMISVTPSESGSFYTDYFFQENHQAFSTMFLKKFKAALQFKNEIFSVEEQKSVGYFVGLDEKSFSALQKQFDKGKPVALTVQNKAYLIQKLGEGGASQKFDTPKKVVSGETSPASTILVSPFSEAVSMEPFTPPQVVYEDASPNLKNNFTLYTSFPATAPSSAPVTPVLNSIPPPPPSAESNFSNPVAYPSIPPLNTTSYPAVPSISTAGNTYTPEPIQYTSPQQPAAYPTVPSVTSPQSVHYADTSTPPPSATQAEFQSVNAKTSTADHYTALLERYQKTLSKIPYCAERTLLSLCFQVTSAMKNAVLTTSMQPYDMSIDDAAIIPDAPMENAPSKGTDIVFIVNELHNLIKLFHEQIKAENLVTGNLLKALFQMDSMIKSTQEVLVTIGKEHFDCETLLFIPLLQLLQKCLQELRQIDTDWLVELLERNTATANLIADKDILLLLGNTGAGKSTLIHYLGGSKFELVIADSGQDHWKIVSHAPELTSFVTSSKFESETILINAVDLQCNGTAFTLCDTPGFEDNRGIEIDIANGLGISSTVRHCRSIRPVVLISSSSAKDRFDGVVDVLQAPIELFAPIEQYLHTFTYVFTKYDSRFQNNDRLYKIVKSKYDSLLVMGNKDYTLLHIFQDMVAKIERRGKVANVIDIARQQPQELLQEILSMPSIENPAQALRHFTTPQNLQKLQLQMHKHQVMIDNAIQRHDYAVVSYKLYQLKLFLDCLQLPDCMKSYRDSIFKLYYITKDLFTVCNERLELCSALENNVVEDDLFHCSQYILQLIQLTPIQKAHFPVLQYNNLMESNEAIPIFSYVCLAKVMMIQQKISSIILGICCNSSSSLEGDGDNQPQHGDALNESSCNELLNDCTETEFAYYSTLILNNLNKLQLILNIFGTEYVQQMKSTFFSNSSTVTTADGNTAANALDAQDEEAINIHERLLQVYSNTLLTVAQYYSQIHLAYEQLCATSAALQIQASLTHLTKMKQLAEVFDEHFKVYPKLQRSILDSLSHKLTNLKEHYFGAANKLKEKVSTIFSTAMHMLVYGEMEDTDRGSIQSLTMLNDVEKLGMINTFADFAPADFTTLFEAANTLSWLKDHLDLLLKHFPSAVAELITVYYAQFFGALRQKVLAITEIVKSALQTQDTPDVYETVVAVQARGILSLRQNNLLEVIIGKEIHEFASMINQYNANLREELANVISLMINGSWEFDAPLFILKLNKLKGTEHLIAITEVPPGYYCHNEYQSISSQLRDAFLETLRRINDTDLSYEKPSIVGSFLTAVKTLAQFSTLFQHQMKMTFESVEEKDPNAKSAPEKNMKPGENNKNAKAAPVETNNSGICSVCKKRIWNLFRKRQCVTCLKHQHRDNCTVDLIEMQLDNNKARMCIICHAVPGKAKTYLEYLANEKAKLRASKQGKAIPAVNTKPKTPAPKKIDFNAVIEQENIVITEASSIADIATQIILVFRKKVKGQLTVATKLFPVENIDVKSFQMDKVKIWKAVQFLNNAYSFAFPEIQLLQNTITQFQKLHFERIANYLQSCFQRVVDETIVHVNGTDHASLANEMLSMFTYLKYLLDYFERFYSQTTEKFIVTDDYYKLLFTIPVSKLMEEWLWRSTSLIPTHIHTLYHIEGASFDEMNVKLLIAKQLKILDTFMLENTAPKGVVSNVLASDTNGNTSTVPANMLIYKDVVLKLEESIRQISGDISLEVKNENYVVLAQFFQGKTMTTETEKEFSREIVNELTSSITLKLEATQMKTSSLVIAIATLSAVEVISMELKALRNAQEHVGPNLNEPLCKTLQGSIQEIDQSLILKTKAFVDTIDQDIKNFQFEHAEEVLQATETVLTHVFGSVTAFDSYCSRYGLNKQGTQFRINIEEKRQGISDCMNKMIAVFKKIFDDAVHSCTSSGAIQDSSGTTTAAASGPKPSTVNKTGSLFDAKVLVNNAENLFHTMQHALTSSSSSAANSANKNTNTNTATDMAKDARFIALEQMAGKFLELPPKQIAENLMAAMNYHHNPFYQQHCNDFHAYLYRRFAELIDISKEGGIPLEVREKIVYSVDKIMSTLAVELASNVVAKLNDAKEKLRVERDQLKRDLSESKNTTILVLVRKMVHYYDARHFEAVYEWKLRTHQAVISSIESVEADLKAENILKIFQTIPTEFEEWINYIQTLQYFQQHSRSYRVAMHHINPQDDLLDQESSQRIVKILDFIAHNMKTIVEELLALKQNDANIFQLFEVHIDKLLAMIEMRKSAIFVPCLRGVQMEEILKSFESLRVFFMYYYTNMEKIICKNEWYAEIKDFLDVYRDGKSVLSKVLQYLQNPVNAKEFDLVGKDLRSCAPYERYINKLLGKLGEAEKEVKVKLLHNVELSTPNGIDRDKFYQNLYHKYCTIVAATFLQSPHLDGQLYQCQETLKASEAHVMYQLETIETFVTKKVRESFPSPDTAVYDDFNIWYDNLRSCRESFLIEQANPYITSMAQTIAQRCIGIMKELDHQVALKIEERRSIAVVEKNNQKIVDILASLKQITVKIPAFKLMIDGKIDAILKDLKNSSSAQRIVDISLILNKPDQDSMYQMILADHSAFQGVLISIFNTRVARFTMEEALNSSSGLSGNELNVAKLRLEYNSFQSSYEEKVTGGLTDVPAAKRQLLHDVKNIIANVPNKHKPSVSTLRDLLVHLFAYWTLSNADRYFDAANSTSGNGEVTTASTTAAVVPPSDADMKKYLMQPHVGQVLSLFRLFGFDDPMSAIKNHLIQIGTGEGKSIILAITASIFALLGFTVHCVCYSEYLSRRDYSAFSQFFTEFAIAELITYGTFNELCELFTHDYAGGSIRTSIESIVAARPVAATTSNSSSSSSSSAPTKVPVRREAASSTNPLGSNSNSSASSASSASAVSPSSSSTREKILLIDEVDVFFTKDFYGNTYRPLAKITDPTITELIRCVWKNRANKRLTTLSAIRASKEYKACIDRFVSWKELLDENVKNMLVDLREFPHHKERTNYRIVEDKIGYKDQDTVSFDISYGYQTLFAYFKAHEEKQITASSLETRIYMTIDCGAISYAEIPKLYTYILGVTGTLSDLSQQQKGLLEREYSIRKQSITPSVYGENRRDYIPNKDICLEPTVNHFNAITNEISERRKVIHQDKQLVRPVLIFFETTALLMQYYKSAAARLYKNTMKLLTEEVVSGVEKESIIRQATSLGAITLLSREFGRGTDFIIFDDRVNDIGGVHVIQTFFSTEVSEETQIRGRSARQGCKGSYSMILSEAQLEKFAVDISAMKTSGVNKEVLDEKRRLCFAQVWGGTEQNVSHIAKEHRESMQFLTALKARHFPAIKTFLLQYNKSSYVDIPSRSRTVVMVDATGSMAALIENTKDAIKIMFDRAYTILLEQKPTATFEVQFVAYRNYNADASQLLQVSGWESTAPPLKRFMDTVEADFGWGNEALEVAFWHVNQEIKRDPERPVSQILLIGDMPPNTRQEVLAKRDKDPTYSKGEAYWRKTRFANPVFFEEEVQHLVNAEVKIHCFYVNDDAAKEVFTNLAKQSSGECAALDVNVKSDPAKAAGKLIDLFTTKILRDIGGEGEGQRLVEEYRLRYGYVK